MGLNPKENKGLTAIEVVASTVLASLLMVAVLGVLQGLKKQQEALESKESIPTWQSNLDHALEYDLGASSTYELSPSGLVLHGYAAREPGSRNPTWLPSTIVYEIVRDGENAWLMRKESGQVPVQELVLDGVAFVGAGASLEYSSGATLVSVVTQAETPIPDDFTVHFLDQEGGLVYAYRARR